MTAVDKHPQKQQIIQQLIDRKPVRQIARQAVPPLNHTTLARFRIQMVAAAAATMRGRNTKVQAIKDIALASDITKSAEQVTHEVNEALKLRVHAALDNRLTRRQGWIGEAEKVPLRNAKGRIVLDAAGEPVTTLDHRALAAHDGNELKDIRTIAELGGLLQQSATAVQVNAVIVMPGPQEQFRQAEQSEAIDIAVVGVDEAK